MGCLAWRHRIGFMRDLMRWQREVGVGMGKVQAVEEEPRVRKRAASSDS